MKCTTNVLTRTNCSYSERMLTYLRIYRPTRRNYVCIEYPIPGVLTYKRLILEAHPSERFIFKTKLPSPKLIHVEGYIKEEPVKLLHINKTNVYYINI